MNRQQRRAAKAQGINIAKTLTDLRHREYLHIHRLDTRATLHDLQETVKRLGPEIERTQRPFFVSVDGYDVDPRELWDIPEVKELCKRCITSGLISLMEVNLQDPHPLFWGAFQVWSCANGLVEDRKQVVTRETIDTFFAALHDSNAIADALIEEQPS